MTRKLTCIECPKGCSLSVKVKDGGVVMASGYKCSRGKLYAAREVEDPMRTLTTGILARGLSFKMVPVKTDKPISKRMILPAMAKIRKLCISKRVSIGDVVVRDFMEPGVNLVVTREFTDKFLRSPTSI